MRDAAYLVLVLKPWAGHRVGAVVAVHEPLRTVAIKGGNVRALEPAKGDAPAEPRVESTTRRRKPMK